VSEGTYQVLAVAGTWEDTVTLAPGEGFVDVFSLADGGTDEEKPLTLVQWLCDFDGVTVRDWGDHMTVTIGNEHEMVPPDIEGQLRKEFYPPERRDRRQRWPFV
jgi:hypothetical protein